MAYKNTLADVCATSFGDLVAKEWQSLVPLIDEHVLMDAHNAGTIYSELFSECGLTPIQRPLKTMERIAIKASVNRPDVPFKTNSDLCGFRFETTDVYHIKPIMRTIQEAVLNAGGMFFIRNSIESPTGKVTDIIQYAFAYVSDIGYIAEIQVGHPFAMYTFTRDSLLRDMRLAGQSTTGLVDLWDNDFYGTVKDKILNSSTEVDVFSLWQSDIEPMSIGLQCILDTI